MTGVRKERTFARMGDITQGFLKALLPVLAITGVVLIVAGAPGPAVLAVFLAFAAVLSNA